MPSPALTPLPAALTLPATLCSRLRDHRVAAAPCEAVGLLLGHREAGRVVDLVELPNRARRGRFLLDARDLLDAEADAGRRGLEVLGPWHSHPAGDPAPSPADHAAATRWPSTIWLVIGREITAWTAGSDGLSALPLRPSHRGSVLQSAAR